MAILHRGPAHRRPTRTHGGRTHGGRKTASDACRSRRAARRGRTGTRAPARRRSPTARKSAERKRRAPEIRQRQDRRLDQTNRRRNRRFASQEISRNDRSQEPGDCLPHPARDDRRNLCANGLDESGFGNTGAERNDGVDRLRRKADAVDARDPDLGQRTGSDLQAQDRARRRLHVHDHRHGRKQYRRSGDALSLRGRGPRGRTQARGELDPARRPGRRIGRHLAGRNLFRHARPRGKGTQIRKHRRLARHHRQVLDGHHHPVTEGTICWARATSRPAPAPR
jgi:hypothetical protein